MCEPVKVSVPSLGSMTQLAPAGGVLAAVGGAIAWAVTAGKLADVAVAAGATVAVLGMFYVALTRVVATATRRAGTTPRPVRPRPQSTRMPFRSAESSTVKVAVTVLDDEVTPPQAPRAPRALQARPALEASTAPARPVPGRRGTRAGGRAR